MRECVITLILAFTASEEEASERIREKREFSNKKQNIYSMLYKTIILNQIQFQFQP